MEERHDGAYLACGVSQEVTYVGDDFTEGQALSSVSGGHELTYISAETRKMESYRGVWIDRWRQVNDRWNGREACDSRVQRGDETKAHSFSGPVVLMFEASQHSVPHVLQHTPEEYAHVLCC